MGMEREWGVAKKEAALVHRFSMGMNFGGIWTDAPANRKSEIFEMV